MNGWMGIAGFVAAYDGWAVYSGRSTLSRSFAETSITHPIAVTLATGYLVTHLYGKWPKKADPLHGYILIGQWVLVKAGRHA